MSDTWNAQDADTEPQQSFSPPTKSGEWIEEHGPLLFVDAIAIVGCSVVLAKAVGIL